jgi:short-subunit dehydrogenase
MELQGKTILLTGASSGIGLELARLLAREKTKLALLARRESILKKLAAELKRSGSAILPLKCDVARTNEVRKACRRIEARFGPVDIAILNSGFGHRAGLDDYDVEAAKKVFAVNVFGLLDFIGELLPGFRRRRRGVIVGVSSLADCRGFPQSGFYGASKTAVSALLESLRVDAKAYNIKVITVKPGFVRTPMTETNRYPMPFLMSAEKAARIIVKGIKKGKKTIEFPLPTVLGAKLLRAMPNSMYEMIAPFFGE